jgi:hypothetical protein
MHEPKNQTGIKTTHVLPRPDTKDAGRVTIGGGAMHFGDPSGAAKATKDSGRVKIGGGAMHFGDPSGTPKATKDGGRVKIGGGALKF